MGRQENIAVFENTRQMYGTDPELCEAVRSSAEGQRIVPETEPLEMVPPRYSRPACMIISGRRSFEAAQAYTDQKVCVLNFASAVNPGGGVVWGAVAQEECLCRCSTLYATLDSREPWARFYLPHREANNPLYNDDCIYTPGVVVFKSDTVEPELLPRQQWWKTDVITCAAPNLREREAVNGGAGITDEALFRLHVKRLRRILNIAASNGEEVVILGAFGCGAFRNPPEIVARAMKQVAEEYRFHFRTIEFAVYTSARDRRNFHVFRETIGGVAD